MSEPTWTLRPAAEVGGYAIRWRPANGADEDGKVYAVDFAIVHCLHSDMDGTNQHYGDDMMSATPDLAEAASVIHGSVKWDGCANWQATEEGVMLHTCGLDDLNELTAALREAWKEAIRMMGETASPESQHEARW